MFENENRFYSEIHAIMEGNLPSYKVINELTSLMETHKTHSKIADIKALLEQAKRGELNLKGTELDTLKRNIDSFDFTLNRTRTVNADEKEALERKIEATK